MTIFTSEALKPSEFIFYAGLRARLYCLYTEISLACSNYSSCLHKIPIGLDLIYADSAVFFVDLAYPTAFASSMNNVLLAQMILTHSLSLDKKLQNSIVTINKDDTRESSVPRETYLGTRLSLILAIVCFCLCLLPVQVKVISIIFLCQTWVEIQ